MSDIWSYDLIISVLKPAIRVRINMEPSYLPQPRLLSSASGSEWRRTWRIAQIFTLSKLPFLVLFLLMLLTGCQTNPDIVART